VADVVDRAGFKHEAPDGVAVLGQLADRTLIATFLPMMGWTALYTVPIPPSAMRSAIWYSPTKVPGCSE